MTKKESTKPLSPRANRNEQERPVRPQTRAGNGEPAITESVVEKAKPEPLREETVSAMPKKPYAPSAWRSPLRLTLFLVAVVLILFVGVSAVFAVGLYRLGWHGSFVDRIVKTLPFPAALADSTIIRYDEYADDVRTLNYYFENSGGLNQQQQKPGSDEITATVLNRLIYDSVVSQLVKKHQIAISESELDEQISTLAETSGSRENVSALLQSLYGWDEAQFKEKVLRPYVALQKLEKTLTENGTLNEDKEKRASDVLAKVKEGSAAFEDLAKEYSDDTTASLGGDLGFFGTEEMDAEFMTAVEALEVGKTTTELVQSQFGYHVIKLLEKVDDPEKGTQYHASHILIRTKTIDDFVNEQIAQRKVRVFLRGFTWDAENHWVVPAAITQG